jgi:glycosyltransferase involved in cell wall biosynthesis
VATFKYDAGTLVQVRPMYHWRFGEFDNLMDDALAGRCAAERKMVSVDMNFSGAAFLTAPGRVTPYPAAHKLNARGGRRVLFGCSCARKSAQRDSIAASVIAAYLLWLERPSIYLARRFSQRCKPSEVEILSRNSSDQRDVTRITCRQSTEHMHIGIVAQNASFRLGGEAVLPLHYFSLLRRKGIDAWLVVNEQNRPELLRLLPEDKDCIRYVSETWLHRVIWQVGELLPLRVSGAARGTLLLLFDQYVQRRIMSKLIRTHGINIIHQPTPVSPKSPSLIFGLGIPVIIGPMNGGMEYPVAFRKEAESILTRIFVAVTRHSAKVINLLIAGKLNANTLLVANDRTRRALPPVRGRILENSENGVDLKIWTSSESGSELSVQEHSSTRFVFMGRLVDWKRLDLAIQALVQIEGAVLEVLGDGAMRATWSELARSLGVSDRVHFLGWLTQPECARRLRGATALVLPSIYECGGAVMLEAMAAGIPVLATAWGGALDYLDETCGILVKPSSPKAIINGFADGMKSLASDPGLRSRLGKAGRMRVEAQYDWEKKIDYIINIYREVLANQR